MLKIISVILVVLISCSLLLQIDDEPDPAMSSFLTKAAVTDTNNEAYFYLMGLSAPKHMDPISVGLEISKQNSVANTYTRNELERPSSAAFNNIKLTDALINMSNIPAILTKHTVLLERYETFISKEGFQSSIEPSPSEVLPAYAYLTTANRLYFLKAIYLAQSKKPNDAVTLLMDNLSNLRMQLTNADSLVGKLVYTSMISQNLDALSILTHQENIVLDTKISALSLAEQDFEKAMSRELLFVQNILIDLDKSAAIFQQSEMPFNQQKSSEDKPYTPAWLVRMLFKPQMSINATYPYYQEIAQLSQLTPAEFSQSFNQQTRNQTKYKVLPYIRNLLGEALMDIRPEFDQHLIRVFDLNAKIAILNQVSANALAIDLSTINNPYYNNTGTAYYTNNKESICLTGPSNDDKSRCLQIKSHR